MRDLEEGIAESGKATKHIWGMVKYNSATFFVCVVGHDELAGRNWIGDDQGRARLWDFPGC